MRRKSRTRIAVYLTVACASLAALAVGLTSALASSTPTPHALAAPAAGSATPQLSAQAKDDFSVFAGPQGTSEDLRVVQEIVGGDDSVSLDPSSVRLAQTSSSGIQVLVAGDSESVCRIGRVPGKAIWGGCGPLQGATDPATPEIGATAYPPGEVQRSGGELAVTALFPNGTSNVSYANPGGNATPVSVVNNTVAFIAEEDATLSWTGPEGHSFSSSLPH
jgi:hypothetical protein